MNIESSDDYVALNGQIIQFNTGDTSHTHTITVTPDQFCEIDPNEYFFSNIVLVSGVKPIQVALPQANITIDDSLEPECGEGHNYDTNEGLWIIISTHPHMYVYTN